MKHIDFLEVVAQILPLVGPENPQRQRQQSPKMHHRVIASVMLAQLVDLVMAVVAGGDDHVRACLANLVGLDLADPAAG